MGGGWGGAWDGGTFCENSDLWFFCFLFFRSLLLYLGLNVCPSEIWQNI